MNKILLLAALFASNLISGQCSPPPPPSLYPVYSVDMDNDGLAPFDIDYLITEYHRPIMEEIYTASSSGYNVTVYNGNYVPTSGIYTNIVSQEQCSVTYEYTGSGPTFNALPPCYWPGWQQTGFQLNAVPHNGDLDGDGILNKDEDTNLNINLMDDDSDGDGQINLLDAIDNTMQVEGFERSEIVIFPNPVRDVLNIGGVLQATAISIFDYSGKMVYEVLDPGTQVNTEMLTEGIYIVKLTVNDQIIYRKVIVR